MSKTNLIEIDRSKTGTPPVGLQVDLSSLQHAGIVIDKNIPVAPWPSVKLKYPFASMEPGDSFFAPNRKPHNFAVNLGKVRSKKLVCRSTIENGVKGCRVWRVM